jgi:hypothetical protein
MQEINYLDDYIKKLDNYIKESLENGSMNIFIA